eukprot:4745364-Amphidinium_carterae.1
MRRDGDPQRSIEAACVSVSISFACFQPEVSSDYKCRKESVRHGTMKQHKRKVVLARRSPTRQMGVPPNGQNA